MKLLSQMFTTLRNGQLARKQIVLVPYSNFCWNILNVLLGNFLLQRLIIMSSDQLFELIFKQLVIRGSLKQAWTNNKAGILARIAERAISLSEDVQTQVIGDLKMSVCVSNTNIATALLVENGGYLNF